MAQQLRVLSDPLEDLGLVPSAYMTAYNRVTPVPGDPAHEACTGCIYYLCQAKYLYTQNKYIKLSSSGELPCTFDRAVG